MILIIFLLVILSFLFATPVFAAPGFIFSDEVEETNGDFMTNTGTEIGAMVAPAYGWAINMFTVMFILGAIVMVFSMIFRNGQWQKYGQTSMVMTFVVLLLLRGMPILMLSIHTQADVTTLFHDGISVLRVIILCVAAISFTVLSDTFKLSHMLIEHPKHRRWGKNLVGAAVVMTTLSFIVPWLFSQV